MKTTVIGIGNEYRHDDGVGPEVVARLATLNLPDASFAVTDGEATELIDLWSGADVGVVVDTVRSDPAQPGKIHEFVVDRPHAGHDSAASSHGLGLGEAIDLALALGRMPRRLVILAVEGADFSPGVGLSPPVAGALDRLVQLALNELSRDSTISG
jgi:hydrogenase maturation protease